MAKQGQYWQLFWIPNFGNLIQAIRFAETRVFPILWYYKLWWFKNPKTWFQTLFSFSVFFFGNQVFVGFFLVVGFAFFAWIPQKFFFFEGKQCIELVICRSSRLPPILVLCNVVTAQCVQETYFHRKFQVAASRLLQIASRVSRRSNLHFDCNPERTSAF